MSHTAKHINKHRKQFQGWGHILGSGAKSMDWGRRAAGRGDRGETKKNSSTVRALELGPQVPKLVSSSQPGKQMFNLGSENLESMH